MADESRRFSRRCGACGSSAGATAARCPVCGEPMSWRMRRRGILIESGLVVAVVLLAVGSLLWLRQRGTARVDESVRVVEQALLDAQPTDLPTFTPALPATATSAPNTPYPPTATPLPETLTHVVQSGDTLYGIAIEYGVSLDDIVDANPDADTNRLSIGQSLLVPVNRPAQLAQAEEGAEAPAGGAEGGQATAAEPAADLDGDAAAAAALPEAADAAGAVAETASLAGSGAADSGESVTVREAEVYRVQPGDTMLGIAITHDMELDALVALNGFESEDTTLSVGQAVVIRQAEMATTTPPPPPPPVPSNLAEADAPVVAEVARDMMYPAPHLLAPGADQLVTGEAPLLRWSSVGELADDVYYVVSIRALPDPESALRPDGAVAELEGAAVGNPARIGEHDEAAEIHWMYSNATAMRLPAAFRPAFGSSRRVEWSVTVRRRSGNLIGSRQGEMLSQMRYREIWSFTWSPGGSSEAEATR